MRRIRGEAKWSRMISPVQSWRSLVDPKLNPIKGVLVVASIASSPKAKPRIKIMGYGPGGKSGCRGWVDWGVVFWAVGLVAFLFALLADCFVALFGMVSPLDVVVGLLLGCFWVFSDFGLGVLTVLLGCLGVGVDVKSVNC